MHVSAALVYAPGVKTGESLDIGTVFSAFQNSIDHIPFLTQKLKSLPMGFDEPYWVPDSRFVLAQHISEIPLDEARDWADLTRQLALIHGEGLNMKRPLWQAVLLSKLDNVPGIQPGSVILMLKVHHACIDGVSLAAMIGMLHKIKNETIAKSRVAHKVNDYELWSRATVKSWSRPIKLAATVSKLLPKMSKLQTLDRPDTLESRTDNRRTRFNNKVNAQRVVGAVRIPIESVRLIKRFVRGITYNDIAVSVIGGALRQYLQIHGELPRYSLVSGVPVNVRRQGDLQRGNKLATMQVGLATDIEDPVSRVRAVHQYALLGKQKINALGTGTIMDISDGLTPNALAEGLRALNFASTHLEDMPVPFHVMITNVPGPQEDIAMEDYPLHSILGLGPIRQSMGLFHIVIQTAKEQTISFTSCHSMMPDPEVYEACLSQSISALVQACR